MLNIKGKLLIFEIKKIKRTYMNEEKKNDLNANKNRLTWTLEEDKMIVDLVAWCGKKKWSLISKKLKEIYNINHRTGKQCRERWHNHLDPDVKKSYWSESEEKIFRLKHSNFGNKWSEISKFLPGRYLINYSFRTDNCIKNHYYSKLRKLIRTILKKLIKDNFFVEHKIDKNLYSPQKLYNLFKKQTLNLDSLNKNTILKLIIKDNKNKTANEKMIKNSSLNLRLIKRKKLNGIDKEENSKNTIKGHESNLDSCVIKSTVDEIKNSENNDLNSNLNFLINLKNHQNEINQTLSSNIQLNNLNNELIYRKQFNEYNNILNSTPLICQNQINLSSQKADIDSVNTISYINNFIQQANLFNLNYFVNNNFSSDIENKKNFDLNFQRDNNQKLFINNLMNITQINTNEYLLNNNSLELNNNISFALNQNQNCNINSNSNNYLNSFFNGLNNQINRLNENSKFVNPVNSFQFSDNFRDYKNETFQSASVNTNHCNYEPNGNISKYKNYIDNKLKMVKNYDINGSENQISNSLLKNFLFIQHQ